MSARFDILSCMSDVVAVGLITGGVGVASAWLSARSAKFQGEVNFLIGEQNAVVERERVGAENVRLREKVRETDRQRRQELYREVLGAHIELFSLAGDRNLPPGAANTGIQRLHAAYAAIQLTEFAPVREAVKAYADLIAEISKASNANPESTWSIEFRKRLDDIVDAANLMAKAMRDGIALTET